MIRYNLVCEKKHEFESWFPGSASFDKQTKRGLIACPACGSTKVEKALMTPNLGRSVRNSASDSPPEPALADTTTDTPAPVAMMTPQERVLRSKLKELREHLVKNAENVGHRFPEEARKMHYGEIEHRSIYGEASPTEARKLLDEGIEFHPLPMMPDERN